MEDVKPIKRKVFCLARKKEVGKMLIPYIGMIVAFAVHAILPDVHPTNYKGTYFAPTLLICMGVYAVLYVLGLFVAPVRKKLLRFAFLLCGIFLFLEVYDVATIKTGTLKMPFIPSPDRVIEQFVINFSQIMEATRASLTLLFSGLAIGLVLGFLSGVLCGCSRYANYWLSPLLKIVGPVPGIVWLPVFIVAFGSSRAGSIAAIVLAVWFPMTLMLSNGIKNTPVELVERAQTLGASKLHIVTHVMIPNAIPSLASALFMSLSGSFGALSAAELCGVKSGLALAVRMQGTIANFGVVFAYVLMMIIVFATLTMVMFAVRNWLLRWQKGLVRW